MSAQGNASFWPLADTPGRRQPRQRSGVKRTSHFDRAAAANDPKRTSPDPMGGDRRSPFSFSVRSLHGRCASSRASYRPPLLVTFKHHETFFSRTGHRASVLDDALVCGLTGKYCLQPLESGSLRKVGRLEPPG
jgi:hypothetical protein